ncbi:TetR family transcriptional regulator [Nocardioides solisilvae]|uniref:TetR family transcriptional regulator n=1 Tax=Nocardioides solisilvae TaxID=1542435 RepID=UPI000D744003|nr:TetR family transcriptional regulator [Nocardioides solisilvae]
MSRSRERLVEAAFALFDERGFEETTVDDVAERAGVGRTTFFRAFRSKEDVIFPDHAEVLGTVRDRLATATDDTAPVAVVEAARLVLQHYLDEGERARIRYRLTRSVPALRAREIASQRQYQQAFRTFVHAWLGDAPGSDLRAELMANAVVTAHNHVLRRWLRGRIDRAAAEAEFRDAMAEVLRLHGTRRGPGDGGDAAGGEASLVVLRTTRPMEELLPALREIAGHLTER